MCLPVAAWHTEHGCIFLVGLQTPVKVPIDISDDSDDEATAPSGGGSAQALEAAVETLHGKFL
jgi:hypothetical protein